MFSSRSTKEIVEYLLKQGKEGEFWDFKQEWHSQIHDLLKDIICFANTSHDEICYLIFGISDSLKIVGMKKSRKKQSDIIDSISHLKFAGDLSPKIELDTISLEGKKIDVLKIFNIENTPIYLREDYGSMKANCVYMRIGDRNTPNYGCADITDIELLWKKRFGLLKPKLEAIYDKLILKSEWEEVNDVHHNIYKPEFVLEIVDDEFSNPEFYSYAVVNESTMYEKLFIKYQSTILDEQQLVVLDGGRLRIPVPDWGTLHFDKSNIYPKYFYKYFVLDSNKARILNYFYNPEKEDEFYAFNELLKVVLFFNTEDEKLQFEFYVNKNQKHFETKLKKSKKFNHINTGNKTRTDDYKQKLHVGLVLNEMLEDWRNTNK